MNNTDNNIPQDNVPQGNMPQGNMQQQYMPQGNMPQGNMPQGNMQQQYMPQGNMPQGNMPQGNMQQQYMPQGNMQQQYMPQGNMQQQYMPQQGVDVSTLDRSSLKGFGVSFILAILLPIILGIISGIYSIVQVSNGEALEFNYFDIIYSVFSLICPIVIIINVIMDAGKIEKLGLSAPSRWWVLFLPVYLWKRSNVLKTSKGLFVAVILISIFGTIIQTTLSLVAVSINAANVAYEQSQSQSQSSYYYY